MTTPDANILFTGLVQPDGQTFDAWPAQPLLLSLEAGGIDWPSSCRNGNCRTCLGHLERGTVYHRTESPGLSTEEQAEGAVLPCVAHPCSDLVLRRSD